MNCECGIPSFFYTTIRKDEIKYEIYKCGTLLSESKKGKCEFIIEIPIKQIEFPKIHSNDIKEKVMTPVKYSIIQELERYINLLEISKNNYGMSRDNYISNINFNLKKLGFPLFYNNKENINSLKLRIYNVVCKKTPKKNYYPTIILEIPENLKTINKKNNTKSKKIEKRSTIDKLGPNLILHGEDFLNKIKKMEIKSDSESESESNEEDNSFDVDNYDSDEIEQYDDSGGLSD
jgi:hypothetical protein